MLRSDDYRVLTAGDTSLVVEFGQGIDRSLSAKVHALDRAISARAVPAIRETLPTFRSLLIEYEPLEIGYEALVTLVAEAAGQAQLASDGGRLWVLPICYDAEMAPDLPEVAERAGLSVAEIVALHSAQSFHVYMLGFLPGQAYMGDNPPQLVLPRRETPRMSIPAGSLAIAMAMSSIFPQVTPCGWHLIGRCPVPMWDFARSDEPLLRPDDTVRFHPVSTSDFHRLALALADSRDMSPESIAELLA